MTALLYEFPVSRDLAAARQVLAAPADHPLDVVETAVTVIDWHGTDEDRARIARLPRPDLITGRTAAQLAEARKVGKAVERGEQLGMARLACAQEALEAHGEGDDDRKAAIQIEAALMLTRMKARREDAQESAARVVMAHRDEWPLIVAGGMVGAVLLLAGTGWL